MKTGEFALELAKLIEENKDNVLRIYGWDREVDGTPDVIAAIRSVSLKSPYPTMAIFERGCIPRPIKNLPKEAIIQIVETDKTPYFFKVIGDVHLEYGALYNPNNRTLLHNGLNLASTYRDFFDQQFTQLLTNNL